MTQRDNLVPWRQVEGNGLPLEIRENFRRGAGNADPGGDLKVGLSGSANIIRMSFLAACANA